MSQRRDGTGNEDAAVARRIEHVERTERKYRAVVEAAPDGVVVIDDEGRIVLINKQTEVLFGYARDELLGELVETLLPAHLRRGHVAYRASYRAAHTTRPMGAGPELTARRKDGSEFPVDVALSPIETDDGWLITAVVRDITDRRRSETMFELLHLVAVAANRAASTVDALQPCIEQVCVVGGWAVAHVWEVDHEAQRLRSLDLWHFDDPERWPELRRITAETRVDQDDAFVGQALAAKRPIWLADLADGKLAAGARPLHQLGIARACALPVLVGADVTHVLEFFATAPAEPDVQTLNVMEQIGTLIGRVVERARALEQNVYAKALERSNRELQLFAYVASHDLREPLRMITSFLGLLAERYAGQLDERAQRYIRHAVDGASRMNELLKSLLEYSRLDTRAQPFSRVDCAAVLDNAMKNLREQILESGAEVVRGQLPEVMADPAQLAQLFQNLLSNAIKFHGPGPPRIRVWARPRGPRWEITVRDDGIGMDMQYAERVFEMFERLHTQEEYPGTGMGLAICKRIVERHSGRIWIESTPGEGSAFHFLLPACGEETKGEGTETATENPSD